MSLPSWDALARDVLVVADGGQPVRDRLLAAKRLADQSPFRKPIFRAEWERFTGFRQHGKREALAEGKEDLASSLRWTVGAGAGGRGDLFSGPVELAVFSQLVGWWGGVPFAAFEHHRKKTFVTSRWRRVADEFARMNAVFEAILTATFVHFEERNDEAVGFVPIDDLEPDELVRWLRKEARKGYKDSLVPGFGGEKARRERARRAGVTEITFTDLNAEIVQAGERGDDSVAEERIEDVASTSHSDIFGWCNSPTEREALERVFVAKEIVPRVRRADRALLELSMGVSREAFAKQLGTTYVAANVRLHRARERARDACGDLLDPELDGHNPVGGKPTHYQHSMRKPREPATSMPRLICSHCGATADQFPTKGPIDDQGSAWFQAHPCNVIDLASRRVSSCNEFLDSESYPLEASEIGLSPVVFSPSAFKQLN